MERSHFSPGEWWAAGTSHLSEHPSPTEADGTEYEILVGWIFALLPRYLLPSTHHGTSSIGHDGIVRFKILCRKSDGNNKYFKRQSAISIQWMGCKIQKL